MCVERSLNPLIRQKIKNFYIDFIEGYMELQNFKLIQQLPASLFIEF